MDVLETTIPAVEHSRLLGALRHHRRVTDAAAPDAIVRMADRALLAAALGYGEAWLELRRSDAVPG